MKRRFGICGVNQFMKKRWKHRNTSKCPQFSHIMETSRHVNFLPAQGGRDRLDKSLRELETWMAKRHSHASLMKLIVARLSEWRHSTRRSIMDKGPEIQKLDQSQNGIGWEAETNIAPRCHITISLPRYDVRLVQSDTKRVTPNDQQGPDS
jgi:hypothetical protein